MVGLLPGALKIEVGKGRALGNHRSGIGHPLRIHLASDPRQVTVILRGNAEVGDILAEAGGVAQVKIPKGRTNDRS